MYMHSPHSQWVDDSPFDQKEEVLFQSPNWLYLSWAIRISRLFCLGHDVFDIVKPDPGKVNIGKHELLAISFYKEEGQHVVGETEL